MAHGKKKWITTYDGRIKRSNDRTKKDYYGDLRWWEPMYEGRWYRHKHKNGDARHFCPQCKHVGKEIAREDEEFWARQRALHDEYDALYGEAEKAWREYRIGRWEMIHDGSRVNTARMPNVPEPPRYYEWLAEKKKERETRWQYDIRSYLCYKCEAKYEKKWEMWTTHMPGQNENYAWIRKDQYRKFRSEGKNLIRKARYEEDLYDEIPSKYVPGWLD